VVPEDREQRRAKDGVYVRGGASRRAGIGEAILGMSKARGGAVGEPWFMGEVCIAG
jgi:hypothetical protein